MTPVGSTRVLTAPTANDGNDNEFAGYYTLRTNPLVCNCGRLMEYVECDTEHTIVVWEEMDDQNLLSTAIELKAQEFNPEVVEYKPAMGKCIDFYTARSKGMFGE